MAVTFEPIATTTLTGNASSITFTGISTAYTDLFVSCTFIMQANAAVFVKINNDTSQTYSWTTIYGDGTSVISARGGDSAGFAIGNIAFVADIPGFASLDFLDYTNTNMIRPILMRRAHNQNGSGQVLVGAGGYPASGVPITRLDFINQAFTNFKAGTSVTIYGIARA